MCAFLRLKIELVARLHVEEVVPVISGHRHAIHVLVFQTVFILACTMFVSALGKLLCIRCTVFGLPQMGEGMWRLFMFVLCSFDNRKAIIRCRV